MLYKFLEDNSSEILLLVEEKTVKLAGLLRSSDELKVGLPVFYQHLIVYLKAPSTKGAEEQIVAGAAGHGRELLRLHYSLSHVVHAYGAMCQAITEFAQLRSEHISTQEFNDLNLCLDIAISSAVSEFQFHSVQALEAREDQRLGFLVHELRNALSSATIAHQMIKQGLVGTGGSTARLLDKNLSHMRDLIDRSLSEVRLRTDPEVLAEKFDLRDLIDQILFTAQSEARAKRQVVTNETKEKVELNTDRQLVLSITANLVQNALKYSRHDGRIMVTARLSGENVILEVADECGGLDSKNLKNLFKPFISGGFDQSGSGLGLTIVQRAADLIHGTVSHRNNEGVGCTFIIEFPQKFVPLPSISNRAVSGVNSARPESSRKK